MSNQIRDIPDLYITISAGTIKKAEDGDSYMDPVAMRRIMFITAGGDIFESCVCVRMM